MRQDSARRLHSVDPCEGLIIVAVRLVWRIPQCLDNPERHTVKRLKNLVGQSDNVGRIGKFAIEHETERRGVPMVLVENVDGKITDIHCCPCLDGLKAHGRHEIAW